jgi:transposase
MRLSNFSVEFRLKILQEITEKCLSFPDASAKYHITHSVLFNWQKNYKQYGVEGLKSKRGRPPKTKDRISSKEVNDFASLEEMQLWKTFLVY